MASSSDPPHVTPFQPKVTQIDKDTPRISKSIATTDYQLGSLDLARRRLNTDVGSIPEVSVDFFCESVLPDIPAPLLEKVTSEIQGKHRVGDRWKGFEKNPSSSHVNETQAYKPLEKIINSIWEAGRKAGGANLTCKFDGGRAPTGERTDKSRPDAYGILKGKKSARVQDLDYSEEGSTSETPRWEDIILAAELKKSTKTYSVDEKDVHDDRLKIIWSAHQILKNDPRRRFTYGFTIENRAMRFWYFSRSHVMVTVAFDFIAEFETIVRIFLGISQATEEKLGYDLSMTPIRRKGEETQYEIRVGDKIYITTRVLSNHAASAITGRATRVWEAYEKGKPEGPLVALKDVWIDADAPSEGQILRDVFAEMEKYKLAHPDAEYPDYRQYFLTTVAESDVHLSKGNIDTTMACMREKTIAEPLQGFWTPHATTKEGMKPHHSSTSTGSHPRPTDENTVPHAPVAKVDPKPRPPRNLRHYRIIFKEVGVAVHHLVSLKENYAALRDAAIGLLWMVRAGYVHRDISTGNILVIEGGGRLSDLEYAKPFVIPTVNPPNSLAPEKEAKTGTREFMACEVLVMRYLMWSREKISSSKKRTPRALYGGGPNPQPGVTVAYDFRFNPIHDFESLWWIFTWTLTRNSPGRISRTESQEQWHHLLFVALEQRHHLLTTDQTFGELSAALPREFNAALEGLDDFRAQLLNAYKMAESSSEFLDPSVFKELPYDAITILEALYKQTDETPFHRALLKRKKAANPESEPTAKRTSRRIQDKVKRQEVEAEESG